MQEKVLRCGIEFQLGKEALALLTEVNGADK